MTKNTRPADAPLPRTLAKSERRQWIRYAATMAVGIRRFGARDDSAWRGELCNVSAAGAGLVSEAAVELEAVLEVRPLHRTWNAALKLMVRVRKLVELPGGSWLLGCTFVRQLTDEELRGLL